MQNSFYKFGCNIVSPNPNFYPGGFHHLKVNPFSTLLPIQAARKKEISCSSESWEPGDPVEPVSKKHVSRHKLSQTLRSTVRTCKPSLEAYKELSSQEMELTRMYEELEQNRSLLQLLLQNCPDSVHHLLDRFKPSFFHILKQNSSAASWPRRTTSSTSTSSCSISRRRTSVNWPS